VCSSIQQEHLPLVLSLKVELRALPAEGQWGLQLDLSVLLQQQPVTSTGLQKYDTYI